MYSSKRKWIIFSTVILIILAFAWYFMIYVPAEEEKLTQSGYRSLQRIAKNILEKEKNTQKIIDNVKDLKSQVDQEIESIDSLIRAYESDLQKNQNQLEEIKTTTELQSKTFQKLFQKSEYSTSSKINSRITNIRKSLQRLNDRKAKAFSNNTSDIVQQQFANTKLIPFPEYDSVQLSDLYQRDIQNLYFESIRKTADGKKLFFRISVEDYMNNVIVSQNLFDHFFVVDVNGREIIYKDLDFHFLIQNVDSLYSFDQGIASGSHQITKIAGKQYRLFYYPFVMESGKVWIINGLVPDDKFVSEARKVEPWIVIMFLLLLIFVLISFPLLKFLLANKYERFNTHNIHFSIISIILGSSLSFLVLLNIYSYAKNRFDVKQKLKELNESIEKRFFTEIDEIHHQLIHLDTVFTAQNGSGKKNYESILADSALAPTIYPFLKEFFWMDSTGLQNIQLSILADTEVGFDLSEREYFKRIITDKPWFLQGNRKFMMQSIYSWSTGEHQVAISTPSQRPQKLINNQSNEYISTPVVALTSNMHSIGDVLMPFGYHFAIIDAQGTVLFSDNKRKNLQENFMQECENDNFIHAAIQSRQSLFSMNKYQNKENRMLIRPLANLPLYLVTYYESQYYKAKDSVVNTIVILFTLSGLVLFYLLYIAMKLSNSYQSKLARKTFGFDWMEPTLNHKRKYIYLSISYLIIFIPLFLLHNHIIYLTDLLLYFFLTITASTSLNYFILKKKINNQSNKNRFLMWNFGITVILLVVLNSLHPENLLLSFLKWLAIIAIPLLLIWLIYRLRRFFYRLSWSIKVRNRLISLNFKEWHTLFIFSWLIINTLIPVLMLYKISVNKENLVWAKYTHLKQVEKKQQRDQEIDKYYELVDNSEKIIQKRKVKGIYCDYLDELNFIPSQQRDSLSDMIHYSFRIPFQTVLNQNKGLVFNQEEVRQIKDDIHFWQLGYDSNDSENQVIEYQNRAFTDTTKQIFHQKFDYFNIPFPMVLRSGTVDFYGGNLLFAAGMILLVIIIYALEKFALNHIYHLNLSPDSNLCEQQKKLLASKISEHNNHLLVIAAPNSKRDQMIEEKLAACHDLRKKEIDFLDLENEEGYQEILDVVRIAEEAVVWIKNFEYDFENLEINQQKIDVLEKLLRIKPKHIIISSDIDNQTLLDFYNRKIEKATDQSLKSALKTDRNKWSYLFFGFEKIYLSLTNGPLRSENTLEDVVKNECRHGSYLENLAQSMLTIMGESKARPVTLAEKEELILQIQQMAQVYYYNLWYACSKEERYFLHDLAKDGFANKKNKFAIDSLSAKGLIKYAEPIEDTDEVDNSLKIMNASFQNFILTDIKPEEILIMEKEQNEKGSWKTFRIAFILILLSIGFFLAYSQQDILNSLNAAIAAITAITALVVRFGNIFSFKLPFGLPKSNNS